MKFLKFVEKTAPIAVYTSGKGSSAAGLTASVIRDSSSVSFDLLWVVHISAIVILLIRQLSFFLWYENFSNFNLSVQPSVSSILKEEPWFWQMGVLSALMSLTK